jgi:hypothetical protein
VLNANNEVGAVNVDSRSTSSCTKTGGEVFWANRQIEKVWRVKGVMFSEATHFVYESLKEK